MSRTLNPVFLPTDIPLKKFVMTEVVVRRCSLKYVFLKISKYLEENTVLESLFNKVAGLTACSFIKRLQ